jgi:hypothetical protein
MSVRPLHQNRKCSNGRQLSRSSKVVWRRAAHPPSRFPSLAHRTLQLLNQFVTTLILSFPLIYRPEENRRPLPTASVRFFNQNAESHRLRSHEAQFHLTPEFLNPLQQLHISCNVPKASRNYAVYNTFKIRDKCFSVIHGCAGRPSDSFQSLLIPRCPYDKIGIDGFAKTLAFFGYLFELR